MDYKLLSEVDGFTIMGSEGNKHFQFSKDGMTMEFPRDLLYQVMMLFGLPKQQEDLVVISNHKMRTVRRQLNIKAKKDIKEGEMITVEIDFPVEESIADKITSFKITK
jgi:hypothetical protein